ncbi:hypothetical protein [Siccirubricoccus phaeus]|uniref:hypothetical protein n=1 Tax=Siccirubricoccus phaeus TaxID=2595053 RepID=UPI0011F23C57|nr:hypothetical protein [Siccirubricoccus phaeus]
MSLTLLPPRPDGGARTLSGRGLLDYLGRLLPHPAPAAAEAPPADPVAVEIAHIAASGLFDAHWFTEQHPEAAEAPHGAVAWQVREAPLTAPHPLFDPAHYQATEPDWRLFAATPLGHYLRRGAAAEASPHPLFDPAWYAAQVPGVPAERLFRHYLTEGFAAGLSPHPAFDPGFYAAQLPELRAAGVNPLTHFVQLGAAQGLSPNPLFDLPWYAARYAPAENPLVHFLTQGVAAGARPHPALPAEPLRLWLARLAAGKGQRPDTAPAVTPGPAAEAAGAESPAARTPAVAALAVAPPAAGVGAARALVLAAPAARAPTAGARAMEAPAASVPAAEFRGPLPEPEAEPAPGPAPVPQGEPPAAPAPDRAATGIAAPELSGPPAAPRVAEPQPGADLASGQGALRAAPAAPRPAPSALAEGHGPGLAPTRSPPPQTPETVNVTVLKPQYAAEPALVSSTGAVTFTGDLLRVEDHEPKRLPNPQATNIAWIHALFGPLLREITGRPCRAFVAEDYPNPLARLAIFRRLQREFSTAGWASLYAGLEDAALEEDIASRFAGDLVVSYELPPYLRRIFDRHGIGFIDLTIHPIRYLPEYMFGIRSNVPAISQRLHALQVPARLFADFARLSAARTIRVFRRADLEPGAALFIGQMNRDSSLIHRGRMYEAEDVETALLELSSRYPKVYYKVHPHRRDAAELKAFVATLPRCEWIDANVYDLLARPEIALAASLSSGTLVEAPFFQRPVQRYIDRPVHVDVTGAAHEEVFEKGQYVAAPPAIFEAPYWAYILGHSDTPPPVPLFDVTRDALRTTLNMKWGR